MPEEVGWHRSARGVELVPRGFQVGRVPQHDRARDQIERASAVLLCLKAGIADAADAVKKDRPFERVLGFALIQLARGTTSLVRLLDPVKREQGALDTSDFPER